jgi:hypothetical protein
MPPSRQPTQPVARHRASSPIDRLEQREQLSSPRRRYGLYPGHAPAQVRPKVAPTVAVLAGCAVALAVGQDRFQAIVVRASNVRVCVDHDAAQPLARCLRHHARLVEVDIEALVERDAGSEGREGAGTAGEVGAAGEGEVVGVAAVARAGGMRRARQRDRGRTRTGWRAPAKWGRLGVGAGGVRCGAGAGGGALRWPARGAACARSRPRGARWCRVRRGLAPPAWDSRQHGTLGTRARRGSRRGPCRYGGHPGLDGSRRRWTKLRAARRVVRLGQTPARRVLTIGVAIRIPSPGFGDTLWAVHPPSCSRRRRRQTEDPPGLQRCLRGWVIFHRGARASGYVGPFARRERPIAFGGLARGGAFGDGSAIRGR